MLKATDPRCEYRTNPVGIPTGKPRFSWKIETDKKNVKQTAYSLELSQDKNFKDLVWASKKTASSNSQLVSFEGKILGSSTLFYWRVKVWSNQGEESPWCTASFETSLLTPKEWKAAFIAGEPKTAGKSSAGIAFRKEFSAAKTIKSARLYASAKGIYEAFCNGKRVGDQFLAPGFTEYKYRLLFQTYDLTKLIKKGANALGLQVGPGWYKGDMAGWLGKRNVFGKQTAIIAQLRLEYDDGSVEIVSSDKTWKTAPSPVLYSEIYHGEIYDATKEMKGWAEAGFDDKAWQPVLIESKDTSTLKPHDGLPVHEEEFFKAKAIFKTPGGDTVIDFGQNISGWVRFTAKGKAGDKIKIRHAETLDAQGNFYTANLRAAKQTIEYICKGEGIETYSPHFTFQGFRYIAIDSWPGTVSKENFEAVAIYSDMRRAGTFKCSYKKLNQFVSNVSWSMKDNFVDVPTDCPQRDERLGWTGDANIFSRAACLLMETAPFYKKWLRDLAASQRPDGKVPHVVPDVLITSNFDGHDIDAAGATAWADAAVGIPWNVYTYFADKDQLEEQYPSMKKWVDYIKGVAQGGLFNTGFHFGDWVALDAKEGSYYGATPNDLAATVYYAYSAELLSKAAAVLGKAEDAKKYAKLREEIGEAFAKEFFTPSGRIAARTQTACILALNFGLVPKAYKARTLQTLVDLLKENKNHLTTGFLGTPYVLKALEENGRSDLAYELLLKEDFPSWLYQVVKGATTIWEHWDGLKPDGTMWSPDMNSFNHYAYGAIADWVFSSVGGLDTDPAKPGFKGSIIKPNPGKEIKWAETKYVSGYGLVSVRWEIIKDKIKIDVEVPPNTTAKVVLPNAKPGSIGGVAFTKTALGTEAEIGSGAYSFSYPWPGK
ncbi:glycoside hydrolase family 78 protein [Leadbettera azotonutricia]|uniref:alpha-L-rhamnosidase n=1 Tax=Leadbettera azotonutricia (strain ATCC BAA-888 / DSM 13862 / ZAS-9) TaxID=545695 RepID=F5Y788_LEAAZ|nr:glycoside hydrolase family 78 protein [Leadbettera azotonutricia]AEF82954.1 alfa-L-rhamnosidase [Leadbettera azotonutricia ZAS-9]